MSTITEAVTDYFTTKSSDIQVDLDKTNAELQVAEDKLLELNNTNPKDDAINGEIVSTTTQVSELKEKIKKLTEDLYAKKEEEEDKKIKENANNLVEHTGELAEKKAEAAATNEIVNNGIVPASGGKRKSKKRSNKKKRSSKKKRSGKRKSGKK